MYIYSYTYMFVFRTMLKLSEPEWPRRAARCRRFSSLSERIAIMHAPSARAPVKRCSLLDTLTMTLFDFLLVPVFSSSDTLMVPCSTPL